MRFDHAGLTRSTRNAVLGEVSGTGRVVKGLDALRHWTSLLLKKVPDDVVKALTDRKMKVQYAHNESYSNDLNIDLYPVRIERFPIQAGVRMTPAAFVKYVRLNINSLLDTSLSRFTPYLAPDTMRWVTDNPVGAVLRIEITPDNAAVVCSAATPTGWTFTTIETPATGNHPVSGHRTFFLATRGGAHYFIVKGLDMTSSGIAGMGLPLGGRFGYHQGDKLWISLQNGIAHYIRSNGGVAKAEPRYSERIAWRLVYHRYGKDLERVFGKGAGSAGKSPFLDIVN